MSADKQQTYKFKWVNIELPDYLAGMLFRADELRRKARMLEAQAEIIDEERNKLETELLPIEDDCT